MKRFRQSMAATAACILDDNPDTDTVTVGITLPRKLIADNHLFLAALSDVAGVPCSWLKPRRRRWRFGRLATTSVAAIILFGAGAYSWGDGAEFSNPAIAGAVLTLVSEHVKPGEPLLVQTTAMRNRHCPGLATRTVAGQHGVVWQIRDPMGNQAKIGGYTTMLRRIVLPVLPPGQYVFSEIYESDCGLFDHETYLPLPVNFTVGDQRTVDGS